MKAVWTHQAGLRLQQILEYIAKDQPENAKRFVNRLIERGDAIGDQPQIGRMVPEYRDKTIREILEGDYRIIYKVLSNRVDILTVRHGSRLLPVDLKQL